MTDEPLKNLAPDELVVVVGPTASGKSSLALDLARSHGGEIIGADSVQIYRHFDIGSGKPSAEEQAAIPHHLIDVADPLEPFDAAAFVEKADRAIAEVRARGALPIVCGGTFLWVKALLFGLAEMPAGDAAIRREHEAFASEHGRAALHDRLRPIDPDAAARLNPNDLVRVSRALEVHALSGMTLTAWHAQHQFRTPRHRGRLLGVAREREDLDARIRRRVDGWLAEGWVELVRELDARGYGRARAMDAVGFRQVKMHLDDALPEEDLAEAIVRATRKFTRRQRTWLRDQPVVWLP